MVTVPEIPVPVTSIPAARVPTFVSNTSAVVLLIAPFTAAVACIIFNVSPATGALRILAIFKVVPL